MTGPHLRILDGGLALSDIEGYARCTDTACPERREHGHCDPHCGQTLQPHVHFSEAALASMRGIVRHELPDELPIATGPSSWPTVTCDDCGEVPADDDFGVCPYCHGRPVWRNIGRDHWLACDEHRVCWHVGSNLLAERTDAAISAGILDPQAIAAALVTDLRRRKEAGDEVAAIVLHEMLRDAPRIGVTWTLTGVNVDQDAIAPFLAEGQGGSKASAPSVHRHDAALSRETARETTTYGGVAPFAPQHVVVSPDPTTICRLCDARFVNDGPGRPRVYCTSCAPPGDKASAGRIWRAANPARVAAFNASRRKTREQTR